MYEIPNLLI